MAPFGLSVTFLWPRLDVPMSCSPVSSASVVLRMRQMYDALLQEAFVFLMRKKQAYLFAVLAQNAAYLRGEKQV